MTTLTDKRKIVESIFLKHLAAVQDLTHQVTLLKLEREREIRNAQEFEAKYHNAVRETMELQAQLLLERRESLESADALRRKIEHLSTENEALRSQLEEATRQPNATAIDPATSLQRPAEETQRLGAPASAPSPQTAPLRRSDDGAEVVDAFGSMERSLVVAALPVVDAATVPQRRLPPPPKGRPQSSAALSAVRIPQRQSSAAPFSSPPTAFVPRSGSPQRPQPADGVQRGESISAASAATTAVVVPGTYIRVPEVLREDSPNARPTATSSTSGATAEPLPKYNFSTVSKLDVVGSDSQCGYVALVEQRYLVHLVPKPVVGSKPPRRLAAGATRGHGASRCAIPAHPIKMLGQSWYVFLLHDAGTALPVSISSGCLEPLTAHLQARLQTQEYMRLTQILDLFLEVALAVELLHQGGGMAHGNIDMNTVFVPRLVATADCAPCDQNQTIVLSGYDTVPYCRNVVYRAPEVGREGLTRHDGASQAADIWSLGVLFCDVINYGVVPLYGFSGDLSSEADAEELYRRIQDGTAILECPEQCPMSVFERIIAPCLVRQAPLRPKAAALVDIIRTMRDERA